MEQNSRIGINKEDFTATDLNNLMKYVVQVLKKDSQEYGAVLTVQALPVIMVIKTLITQLFINLIGNSPKYHVNKKTVIKTRFNEEQDNWVFYVKKMAQK